MKAIINSFKEKLIKLKKGVVITVASQKGGCGKTTLTINLAVSFAKEKLKVLIIDTDIQGSCVDWLNNLKEENLKTYNIEVIASSKNNSLKELIDNNIKQYDVIFIDSQAKIQKNEQLCISLADIVLIPVEQNQLNLWATAETAFIARNFINDNKKGKAFFIFSKVLSQVKATSLTFQSFKDGLNSYGLPVLENYLTSRSIYSMSIGIGSVFSSKNEKAKNEVIKIRNEVIKEIME